MEAASKNLFVLNLLSWPLAHYRGTSIKLDSACFLRRGRQRLTGLSQGGFSTLGSGRERANGKGENFILWVLTDQLRRLTHRPVEIIAVTGKGCQVSRHWELWKSRVGGFGFCKALGAFGDPDPCVQACSWPMWHSVAPAGTQLSRTWEQWAEGRMSTARVHIQLVRKVHSA